MNPYYVQCKTPHLKTKFYGPFSSELAAVDYVAWAETQGCCGEHDLISAETLHPYTTVTTINWP